MQFCLGGQLLNPFSLKDAQQMMKDLIEEAER